MCFGKKTNAKTVTAKQQCFCFVGLIKGKVLGSMFCCCIIKNASQFSVVLYNKTSVDIKYSSTAVDLNVDINSVDTKYSCL